MKKPTGTADIPIHVMKAKDLKEKISAHEVIGFCEENEELDFDSFDVEKSLSSANLSDTAGEVKRPETKKQKSSQLADAIKTFGDGQKEAALGLQSTTQAMATSISGNSLVSMVNLIVF